MILCKITYMGFRLIILTQLQSVGHREAIVIDFRAPEVCGIMICVWLLFESRSLGSCELNTNSRVFSVNRVTFSKEYGEWDRVVQVRTKLGRFSNWRVDINCSLLSSLHGFAKDGVLKKFHNYHLVST